MQVSPNYFGITARPAARVRFPMDLGRFLARGFTSTFFIYKACPESVRFISSRLVGADKMVFFFSVSFAVFPFFMFCLSFCFWVHTVFYINICELNDLTCLSVARRSTMQNNILDLGFWISRIFLVPFYF